MHHITPVCIYVPLCFYAYTHIHIYIYIYVYRCILACIWSRSTSLLPLSEESRLQLQGSYTKLPNASATSARHYSTLASVLHLGFHRIIEEVGESGK